MHASALKSLSSRLLLRVVLAVRRRVLHQPRLRAVLRTLGRPFIRAAFRPGGPGPPPAPPPERTEEPVLRLPLEYPLAQASGGRMAVLLHVAGVEAARAFTAALERLNLSADLLVTVPEPQLRGALEALLTGWGGGALAVRVGGESGGAAGQLAAFPQALDDYELLLFLRAEDVQDRAPAEQRELVLKTFLGSPAMARSVIEAFLQAPRLGVVAPRISPAVRPQMIWGETYAACRQLAGELGFALYPDSPLDFPAGGTFWARSAALRPLLGKTQLADAPAAAADRLIFHACELSGLRWMRAGSDAGSAPPEAYYTAEVPRLIERMITDCGRTVLAPGRRPHPARDAAAGAGDKAAFRALCRAELERFLASAERLALPTSDKPAVSIVLLLFNQAELTFQCLRSLQFALDVDCELIIADNASTDLTHELLGRIDGARIIRNAENLHFVRGVNAAAAQARGRHLLLLNNDTRVTPGSIAAAAGLLDAEPDVGAVGGRVELLDGTLQEAGSIIWRDGVCAGYGRGADPSAPEFQFRREVDYCSAAFLMVRRTLFESLGGFDEAFAPAYYEETDLCMRIRDAGARVVYEPRVHIVHFEFGSSTNSEAALALQQKHWSVFVARHRHTLEARHQAPGTSPLQARMRGAYAGRVLILEDQLPYPHLGAGYPRALDILQAASRAGWFVTLFPTAFPDVDFAAAAQVLAPDVEIAAERGRGELAAFLRERAGDYDAVIVSRPHNMQVFREALARVPQFIDLAHVVYDAEAIFALREAAREKRDPTLVANEVAREAALAEGVGGVFAVNEQEAATFRAHGAPGVEVIGHALAVEPTQAAFEARRDLLFVGALDLDGSPNADSLVFFVREVMPRLDELIGADYVLRVAGRQGAAGVRALEGPRVQLLGRVEDLTELYGRSRIFIAPTRFAAGIPMKVHAAAAAGVPAAVSSLLARQLGWRDGCEVAVGDTAAAFANACRRLYSDAELWTQVREGALARIAAECQPEAFSARIAATLERVRRPQAASSSSILRMSVTGEATPPSSRITLLQ